MRAYCAATWFGESTSLVLRNMNDVLMLTVLRTINVGLCKRRHNNKLWANFKTKESNFNW